VVLDDDSLLDVRWRGVAMKIALIHHLRRGGAHRRIVEQLRCLPSDLTVEEFIIEGAEPVTENPHVIAFAPRGDAAPAWKKPVERYRDLSRLELAWAELEGAVLASNCDAVWANPCRELQVPPLGDALARKTVLYLDEPSRQYFDPSVKNSTRRATRPLYFRLNQKKRSAQQRNALKMAKVVTNSAFTAQMIESAYGRIATVIPLGVHHQFKPGPNDGERRGALSVGTLIPSKGHDLAIAAVATQVPKLALTVIAPRQEQVELERLQSLANDASVDVTFHFGVSDEALVDAYQSAAVTLYLAKAEPFGLVSVEAQACGSTMVLVDEGGLPETAAGNPLVIVAERTVDAIAAAMATALRPVDAAERQVCAESVQQRWSWDVSSKLLADALKEVACR
jgi:glycosyltransferase involved in cell wall biosynthesis